MKIVIVGGHLSPALSVIQKLKKEDLIYFGRKHTFEGDHAISLEHEEINKLGIPFYAINTSRVQRKFTRHTLLSFSKFPVGFYQSFNLLKRLKPDVVLGFGGYLSVPVCLSAYFLKIPIVIHEQTLEAGFANKMLSKIATKICVSWEDSIKFFPKEKTVLTGIPLREEVINAKNMQKDDSLIYVTGGSAGSHSINLLVEQIVENLLGKFRIIHQTGDAQSFKDYERIIEEKKNIKNQDNYIVKKFLSPKESAETLAKATLVVGRAGMNTVTEILFHKTPALLIPLPFGQKNEQLNNAKLIKEAGLGEYLLQDNLTDKLFLEEVLKMLKNIKEYKTNKDYVAEDATDKIIKVLRDVSKQKNS